MFNKCVTSSNSSPAAGVGESVLAEICCLGSNVGTSRPAIEKGSMLGHFRNPGYVAPETIYYFVNRLGSEREAVVQRYNDHLYNGNFDFRRSFFGNGSFLMKIYYIL